MPIVSRLLMFGCATLVLAGCTQSADDDARERAMKDARDKAVRVSHAIEQDHVWQADQYAHSAAQVNGVEVMRVEGAARNSGDGVTLIIRVHGLATRLDSNGQESGQVDLPVCFKLAYDRNGHDDLQGEVKCPATAPISIAKDPELPGDIDETLRQALPRGAAVSEAAVRSAVDALALDPGVRREVGTGDGDAIGVALRGSQYDCVMARVTPDDMSVWRPSRVQLAPGELSCSAATAAAGEGQKPPH